MKVVCKSNTSEEKMKVPIGFRFRPTDEELVVHYLKRKALALPLPASIIPNLTTFNIDPWSLPGDLKDKRYYFWKRKGELRNKFIKVMPTSSGFWKDIGKLKQIISDGAKNAVIGTRKTWTFYQFTNQPYGHWSKTRWLMHEFQLVDFAQNETYQAEEWVVCRVFQRRMKHKNHKIITPKCTGCEQRNVDYNMGYESPSSFDFKAETDFDMMGPPSPCSTTD